MFAVDSHLTLCFSVKRPLFSGNFASAHMQQEAKKPKSFLLRPIHLSTVSGNVTEEIRLKMFHHTMFLFIPIVVFLLIERSVRREKGEKKRNIS